MNYDTIKFLNFEDFSEKIETLDLSKENNVLNCYLTLKKENIPCPICGSTSCNINDYREKKIIHSISTSSPCYVFYKARRYKCKLCNKVFYENNPFSLGTEKISAYTILSVLESLRSHTSTFTSVALQYNLTKQTVMNIFDTYVDCKKKTFPNIICIDEFYTSKISATKYACVILDFQTRQICEVYSSRHMFFLAGRFTLLTEKEKENVKIVIIDMWDTYKELTHRYFKKAIVAVDSFHVIKHLNEAIIKVRIKVMQKFNKNTETLISNDMYYYMLKKFHYFFVKNYEDIYDGDIKIPKINAKWRKDEILKYLLSIDKDLDYAYRLKERYREFNLTAEYSNCENDLNGFIDEFCNSHLQEFREFGKMIRHWKTEIKNSFIRLNSRRLSNGVIEGVNSRIKTIIKNANGYCNFGRLRNKIMFSINKNEPIINNPKI